MSIHNIQYNQTVFLFFVLKTLTLASPASNQSVALLALTVVRAHIVDTAPPLAIGRPLTLVDI